MTFDYSILITSSELNRCEEMSNNLTVKRAPTEHTVMDSDQKLAREFATRPMEIWVLESMVVVIALLTSVTGNVFVLLSVYRNTRLRKPANLYIVSLAITDLGMGVLSASLAIGAIVAGQWMFGLAVCWFNSIISYALAIASILTMLLIAVNRYYKIVKPNKYSSVFSLRFIVASIVLAWILALTATLAVLLRGSGVRFHPGYATCFPNVRTKDIPVLFTVYTLCAVLPCCIISLLYYKIWIYIKRHNAHMNESQVNLEELKLTRSLFVVVGSFIVCYTPYIVVSSLEVVFELSLPRQLYFFTSLMVFVASCVNPLIYGVMNREFRKEFLKIVPSCCVRRSQVLPTNM